jgi:hypothetical protein
MVVASGGSPALTARPLHHAQGLKLGLSERRVAAVRTRSGLAGAGRFSLAPFRAPLPQVPSGVALVAQGIERRFPKPCAKVRILPGARISPARCWCHREPPVPGPTCCPSFGWAVDGSRRPQRQGDGTWCCSTKRDDAGKKVTHGVDHRRSALRRSGTVWKCPCLNVRRPTNAHPFAGKAGQVAR